MKKDFIVLEYHDNFADNLSSCALARIIEDKYKIECYRENITSKREKFESKMLNFAMDYKYISSARVQDIAKKASKNNDFYINSKKILNKKNINNKILNLNYLDTGNLELLTDDFLADVKFKKIDFIKNYDILEYINDNNTIGIYLNKEDVLEQTINYKYINNALLRLNKYIKKPKFIIFSNYKELSNIAPKFDIDTKFLNIQNWKEEFYLLTCCKHKIIINSKNSYSNNLWASILNQKSYHYTIYDKKLNKKANKTNWIRI